MFGGRIVIQAAFEELCITESRFDSARPGSGTAPPHRQHADSFYVLEGELGCPRSTMRSISSAPAGARARRRASSTGSGARSPARFLNFHTPDRGFAENLRDLDRGGPGGFDSFDAEGRQRASGLGRRAAPGRRGRGDFRGRPARGDDQDRARRAVADRVRARARLRGPFPPHSHDDHVDSFYVLEGEAEFLMEGEQLLLGTGSFVAAPPGVEHTFTGGPGRSRLLNVHARARASTSGYARTASRARTSPPLRLVGVGSVSTGGETGERPS